uniref:Uncharacterized protein n=1 Tax=Podoviridae sp. ct8Lf7 TaxID=2827723 RepID=A0A8S5S1N0_9CAUD|nr:MAG TPA: hypothetical protein [Podoviridae sp. ct8Lf7]
MFYMITIDLWQSRIIMMTLSILCQPKETF